MNVAATEPLVIPTDATAIFERVVVGVDGSEPGFEAVRQAARLVSPEGSLEVFTAVYLAGASLAGWSASQIAEELEREAGEAIRKGVAIAGARARSRLVNGPAARSLLDELEKQKATVAVVGTHGHSRLSEIVLGGVAGELLHNAPCSVLVARVPAVPALFPRAIVAGFDGSPESEVAVAAARYLARRLRASLSVLSALEHPVGELVDASADADILVVGSRGLRGLKALGSVSERVAHEARSSVLVVRSGIPPAHHERPAPAAVVVADVDDEPVLLHEP